MRRGAGGGRALSAALYLVAVRPFRGDVLGWVAGALAAGLLVRELVALPFAQQAYALPDPLGSPGTIALGGGVTVPVRALECSRSGSSSAWRSSGRWR